VFDFVREDGSRMDLALPNAIDITANMVWVDKPLNQGECSCAFGFYMIHILF
jgi:hypothetical protein